jgi:Na+/H+ antiporter NhaB
MGMTTGKVLWLNLFGQVPDAYKLTVVFFLLINPLVFFFITPFLADWLLVGEFILTLGMALRCYSLLPGGLLVLEAVMCGRTSPAHVSQELAENPEVSEHTTGKAFTEALPFTAQRRVAIVAMANKLARTIWAITAHNREYDKNHVSIRLY